ncbi:MAG: sugar phosphate isomerase/epimerase [Acidobacteriota bacterium]
MMSQIERRGFLAGGLSLAALGFSIGVATTATSRSDSLRLGVASYSLRKFSRTQAIEMIKSLRILYVNIKEFHLRYASTPEELRSGRQEFESAGLQIVGGGTIALREDSDDDIRRYFEYAKTSGMPLMVIAPTRQTLPRIERFVKEYNIQVAVHNHGPEDEHFPAPQDALREIRSMDPRVGLCIDVGHTARAGADVVKSIAEAGRRLLDMHIKDLRSFSDRDSQCVVGQGIMPVAEIFKQLIKMKYEGCVNLEYEIDADSPLPGMQQSFAYMRGVLKGLAA